MRVPGAVSSTSATHTVADAPAPPSYGPPYDTAGLLETQRSVGGVPKLFLTNSAWEYWRGDGALVHQDAETGADLPEDPDARTYLIAGTDHIGATAIKEFMPTANPTHVLDAATVMRALFVRLERWACDKAPPPPSRVPRRTDGSAVERDEVLKKFHGVATPDVGTLSWTPLIDPESTQWPLELGERLVALVSEVDVAATRSPASDCLRWQYRSPRTRAGTHALRNPDFPTSSTSSSAAAFHCRRKTRLPIVRTCEAQVRAASPLCSSTTGSSSKRNYERVVDDTLRLFDDVQSSRWTVT